MGRGGGEGFLQGSAGPKAPGLPLPGRELRRGGSGGLRLGPPGFFRFLQQAAVGLGLALRGGGLVGGVLGPAALLGGGAGLGVLGIHRPAPLVPGGGLQDFHGPGVVLHHRHRPAGELLNGLQILPFIGVAEGNGRPAPPGPAGGEVVVEQMGELLDVQPPCGDIGGNQHLNGPALEVGQGLLPGGLALVAVNGGGGDARFDQICGHLIGPVLGAGKDQGVFHLLLLNELGEQLCLVPPVHVVQPLLDDLHRGGHWVHRHPDRLVKQGIHQPLHLRRHGGGEEQRLLLLGQPAQNALDVMNKAHVQHPVGLIQNKNFQPGQINEPLSIEVPQPSGGGDQNIHPSLEALHLGSLPHAAENDGTAQREVLAIGLKALVDLQGQLPGRGENQGANGPAGHRRGGQPLKNRGGKGAGLTGAGLGAAQHVPPGQRGGDGFFLNGGGLLIALVGQGPENGGAEAEFLKGHEIPSFFTDSLSLRRGARCRVFRGAGAENARRYPARRGHNAAKPAGGQRAIRARYFFV